MGGHHAVLRVAARLAAEGADVGVFFLRWLAPLPAELLAAANATGRVLAIDETRQSGGVSEGVIAALIDGGFTGTVARVTSAGSFIPLGEAAAHVLLRQADIEAAAGRLLGVDRRPCQSALVRTEREHRAVLRRRSPEC